MSGSSLDGLDIAYCHITHEGGNWSYKIVQAECIEYSQKWKLRLAKLALQNAITYLKASAYYGQHLGNIVKKYIEDHNLEVDFIASHGHTVFHQPENNVSSQVGDGAALAAVTGLPVVSELRSMDVNLNGQGAPLVPVGDRHLFPGYSFWINLGGIGNISCQTNNGNMIGFDICPVNYVLNDLAGTTGAEFDENGNLGRAGNINNEMLEELNSNWYYDKPFPKSLGVGWINKVIFPIISNYNHISVNDKLRTMYEHIALQITGTINSLIENNAAQNDHNKILITGGGAFNGFLIERIKEHTSLQVDVPDSEVIKFKEALIMAFIGALRMRNEVNCLASVTGASRDSVVGAVHWARKESSNL